MVLKLALPNKDVNIPRCLIHRVLRVLRDIYLCKWMCQWMEYALIPPKHDSCARLTTNHQQSAVDAKLLLRGTYVCYFTVYGTISWI